MIRSLFLLFIYLTLLWKVNADLILESSFYSNFWQGPLGLRADYSYELRFQSSDDLYTTGREIRAGGRGRVMGKTKYENHDILYRDGTKTFILVYGTVCRFLQTHEINLMPTSSKQFLPVLYNETHTFVGVLAYLFYLDQQLPDIKDIEDKNVYIKRGIQTSKVEGMVGEVKITAYIAKNFTSYYVPIEVEIQTDSKKNIKSVVQVISLVHGPSFPDYKNWLLSSSCHSINHDVYFTQEIRMPTSFYTKMILKDGNKKWKPKVEIHYDFENSLISINNLKGKRYVYDRYNAFWYNIDQEQGICYTKTDNGSPCEISSHCLQTLFRSLNGRLSQFVGLTWHRGIMCEVFEISVHGVSYGGGYTRYLVFAQKLQSDDFYTHYPVRIEEVERLFSFPGAFELYEFQPLRMNQRYQQAFDVSACAQEPEDQDSFQLQFVQEQGTSNNLEIIFNEHLEHIREDLLLHLMKTTQLRPHTFSNIDFEMREGFLKANVKILQLYYFETFLRPVKNIYQSFDHEIQSDIRSLSKRDCLSQIFKDKTVKLIKYCGNMECYLSKSEYNEYAESKTSNKILSKEPERGCLYYAKERAFESSLNDMYDPSVVKFLFFAQMQQPIQFVYGDVRINLKPLGFNVQSFDKEDKRLFTLEARDHKFSDQIIKQCNNNGSYVESHSESFIRCFQACHQSALDNHGACLSFSVCPANPHGWHCELTNIELNPSNNPKEDGQVNMLNTKLLQEFSGCRVYRLNPLQMFTVHNGLKIQQKTFSGLKLTNISNEADCAKACIQTKKANCSTFEFVESKENLELSDENYHPTYECTLYPVHVFELFSDEKFSSYLSESSFSRLHSVNKLASFHPTSLRQFTSWSLRMSLAEQPMTRSRCAFECEQDAKCSAFNFCIDTDKGMNIESGSCYIEIGDGPSMPKIISLKDGPCMTMQRINSAFNVNVPKIDLDGFCVQMTTVCILAAIATFLGCFLAIFIVPHIKYKRSRESLANVPLIFEFHKNRNSNETY